MNVYFLIAAGLAFAFGLTHTLLGERFFLPRLFQCKQPFDVGREEFVNRTTRTAWHLTTIAWWNAAAILTVLAFRPFDQTVLIIVRIISNIFLLSGILSLLISRARNLSWIVFFAISLVAWLGTVQ